MVELDIWNVELRYQVTGRSTLESGILAYSDGTPIRDVRKIKIFNHFYCSFDLFSSMLRRTLFSRTMSTAKKLLGDYSKEPPRTPELIVNSKEPFNAETPPPLLVKDFKTPVDLFYVRSHGPTPDLDASSYKIELGEEIKPAFELSLSDVQAIGQPVTIDATLTCAGNRRNELNAINKVKGVGWEISAIGNATWTGVRLRDVLMHAKADVDSPHLHVEFIGEEDCEEKTKYGSSIPMTKAADPKGDVLLAWEMNGKPLTRDHGFPLRVVVPGYIGARSVKWLRKINVIPQESQFCYQQRDYKLFLPHVNWDTVDALWDSAFSLSELSVQSAICEPKKDEIITKDSSYTIKGYAVSNGRRITRVDVSVNNGADWETADIVGQDKREEKGFDNRYWSWTLWEFKVKKFPSPCTICCRAWDSSANTQPEQAKNIWNLRGVMNNAWHRVEVRDH